jgi:hypothetical protein
VQQSKSERDEANQRRRERYEAIKRKAAEQEGQMASALRAYQRVLKLIDANPSDDPWRGATWAALSAAQRAGREAFGCEPVEFVRDTFSDQAGARQELLPGAAPEWLLCLYFPSGRPVAHRLGLYGELEEEQGTIPKLLTMEVLAGFRADVVGCLKQWIAEFLPYCRGTRRRHKPKAIQTPPADGSAFVAAESLREQATHSTDFRSVSWYGTPHEFTELQAACVKVLWEAMDNITPTVGDATILEEVESNAERLGLVFRDHAAWGTMIVEGQTKGTHRLAEPPKS